jgi:cyclophilin family peptidyl-prolyl cis-trans isomerase/HEAT repeat protein
MPRDDSPQSRRTFARRWKLFCSAILLGGGGACRFGVPAPLSPQLQARARLLRIEDTRRDEPALIDSLLSSRDVANRAAAALTVGRIGARAHLEGLRRLATDADSGVAANALFSLGLLKDTASASLAALALRAGSAQGTEAAWLLGELGERGRATIVAGLSDASLAPTTRGALLIASTRLRPMPAAAIAPLLASQDSAIAWRAAYAIARGRSAAAARSLLGQSASPWSSVREQVARGALRGIAGDSLGTVAREALLRLIADTSARVRINAVRAIASYGAPARVAVLGALRDPDLNVRIVAAQSLDPVLDTESAAWADAFDAETTFVVRRAIADGAIKHGANLAARAGWASSDEWRLRAAAAELDGMGAAGAAEQRLGRWSRDPDERVRAAAASAYAALADSAPVRDVVRSRLRPMLTDPDVGVRTAALRGLTRGASLDDLASALVSYRISLVDVDNDARLAFWRLADTVLARHVETLSDSVQRGLTAILRPVDPLERNTAARIGRFSAWRDSAGTARPLAWYEARARESAVRGPTLRVLTERGTMELQLFPAEAPLTVYNIVSLAEHGYFDGQRFHRVVPNFVVQGGDPRGDGNGGPGYAIRDEFNRRRYGRGTLGMALSGPNTGGSQFFVTHSPQPHLDGGYTVFGELVEGGDVLDRIIQGDRIVRVTVH